MSQIVLDGEPGVGTRNSLPSPGPDLLPHDDPEGSPAQLIYSATGSATAQDLGETVNRMRDRLEAGGIEAEVRFIDGEISVRISGEDLSEVDRLLRARGVLEFRPVLSQPQVLGTDAEPDGVPSREGKLTYQLGPTELVGGVETASAARQGGAWLVDMEFTREGAEAWDDMAAKYVGQRVAIVLDGVVQSAPTIQQAECFARVIVKRLVGTPTLGLFTLANRIALLSGPNRRSLSDRSIDSDLVVDRTGALVR